MYKVNSCNFNLQSLQMVFFIAAQELKECVVYYVLLGKLFKTVGVVKFTKNSLKLKILRGKQAQIHLLQILHLNEVNNSLGSEVTDRR